MKCKWHCCNKEALDKNPKGFCSKQCKNKFYVDLRRKKLKQKAIEYKGGKCELCSYSKCIAALEFHHKNSQDKDFGIAANGHTKSWENLKKELNKCQLVCANCHRELHST